MIVFCRQNLAPYKVPMFVEFHAALLKTMVGTVLRRALIEQGKQSKKPASLPRDTATSHG